jgi:hypothetical protein
MPEPREVPGPDRVSQAFVCPECAHHSTYDPWVASACCPQCGFSPSASDGPAPELPGQDRPAEPLREEKGVQRQVAMAVRVISVPTVAGCIYVLVSEMMAVPAWIGVLSAIAVAGLVVGLVPVWSGLVIFDWRRCPRCRAWRTRQVVREEVLGIFPRGVPVGRVHWDDGPWSADSDQYKTVRYAKYRVHYRCKRCGHEWTSTAIEKV